MTPKRYFAFGCITILIQGGVLASQISESTIQLSEGTAMGVKQAVSVVIAMQANSQAQGTANAVKEPTQIDEPIAETAVNLKPIVKATSATPTIVTPGVNPEKIITAVKTVQPLSKSTIQPAIDTEIIKADTDDSALTYLASLAADTLTQKTLASASLGVTQQTVALPQPTFLAPPTQPHYPKAARKRGFEGTATVEVMFNQIGEQLSLTLVDSSGYNLLDAAAIDAVEQWQFSAPTPQTAYAYTVRVPVKFALN